MSIIDECVNKLVSLYSKVKGNEVTTHATTWIYLETFCYMTEAIRKGHVFTVHLYELSRLGKSIETVVVCGQYLTFLDM